MKELKFIGKKQQHVYCTAHVVYNDNINNGQMITNFHEHILSDHENDLTPDRYRNSKKL